MSNEWLFFILVLMGLALTYFHMKEKTLLLAFAPSMIWFSLGMWLFFSSNPPLDIAEGWVKILVYVFFGVLVLIPWVNQMNTEIKRESGGRSWVEWGSKPEEKVNRAEEYRKNLRKRIRR